MPTHCPGAGPGSPCIFSTTNPGQPARMRGCVFCFPEKLSAAMLSRAKRSQVVRHFKGLSQEHQTKALERVPEEYHAYLHKWTNRSERCKGLNGQPCTFALTSEPCAAKTMGRTDTCLFCSPARLSQECATAVKRAKVQAMLMQMGLETRRKALDERIPARYREQLASATEAAIVQPSRHASRKRARPGADPSAALAPETLQQEHSAAAALWAGPLRHRRSHAAPPSAAERKTYREKVLEDRARGRRGLGMPTKRVARGADVTNHVDLPPAKRTRRAANLEHWCLFNSWGQCPECRGMQPRPLTPATMKPGLRPFIPKRDCSKCSSKCAVAIPAPEDVPAALQGLTDEAVAALSPLEIDTGPVVRAQGNSGYRFHMGMIRFAWHATTVRERIKDIRDADVRAKARAAYKWLRRSEDSAYLEFDDEHKEFLRKNPDPEDSTRKRWLRFIERDGIECACWPHLFWDVRLCLSHVRATDPRRLARQSKETVEDVLDARMSDEEAAMDGEEPEDDSAGHSIKRAYAALVLSPVIGYGASYDLLHYAYDLSLWTDLGAKRNLGVNVPLRLLMKNHSFSPEFWRSFHGAVIDLVRQRGYSQIFWTKAPYEWSFPYHEFIREEMAQLQRPRLQHGVLEALHMAHVLMETNKEFVMGQKTGSRGWKGQHLLGTSAGGAAAARDAFVLRLEFQDGSRKAATQDYHGSGRPHTHLLGAIDRFDRVAMDRVASASLPSEADDADLRCYVRGSQIDRDAQTPIPIREDATCWDAVNECWRLHHSESDHDLGLRAYFPETLDALKCHEELQIGEGGSALRQYVTKYVPKFSDQFAEELLNDDASGDSVAMSVLMRYKPAVPEMVLQLFGARFRQWAISTVSRGKRDFRVPVPDEPQLPEEIAMYESCAWRGEEMSLLDFLRKSNDKGEIIAWLRRAHKVALEAGIYTGELNAFAREYKPQGEKVVSAQMLSRNNDRFYGQWLVLHVPFRRITDLIPADDLLAKVPPQHRYFAMAVSCTHVVATRMWCVPERLAEEMEMEAHSAKAIRSFIDMNVAHKKLVDDYVAGRLDVRPAQLAAGAVSTASGAAPACRRLPLLKKYADYIRDGSKDIEGRVDVGAAAAVREGQHLMLGEVRVHVLEVYRYASFENMLEELGTQRAIPDARTLGDAVRTYHGFRGYAEKEKTYGVVAFRIEVPSAAASDDPYKDLNGQQRRFYFRALPAVIRSLAYRAAASDAEAQDLLSEALRDNRACVCLGPPGTGKTYVMDYLIEAALERGAAAQATGPTAQLVSRMRERYGNRIHLDTCHAAYGLDEDGTVVQARAGMNDLEVIDELSQLDCPNFDKILRQWQLQDRRFALTFCGDRFQMAGYGDTRPWDSRYWKTMCFRVDLHEVIRCKDMRLQSILKPLRTTRPDEQLLWKLRKLKAWRGVKPDVNKIRSLLLKHPNTTMMAFTRLGAALLNDLAMQAKYPRREPLTTLRGDVEAYAANYERGVLKAHAHLQGYPMKIYRNMPVYLTKNVRKDIDYVNGMQAHVQAYDATTKGLRVLTTTGFDVLVTPWADKDRGNMTYYPIRPGWASTVIKFQGAELDHVTLYCDCPGVPGGAYTAISRVRKWSDILIGGKFEPQFFVPAR